ncbi:uncharacterized protein RHO25_013000 [Cercospora beticola]|uniref:Transcription factor domain-containing protein n=1 Tax=Cercospora beticola TaxID=122368 RepID=A0ABZ0P8U5_CERBT|nr:hypothetical protein RHO25_013000 [Cercospora beticola]CAK1367779.1 unnamed protein product [Cercospora beticola]
MKTPLRHSITPPTDGSLIDTDGRHDGEDAEIDDFLLVKPKSTDVNSGTITKTKRLPTPMDKARATFDSAHLLSTLLARDVHFGADFSRASPSRDYCLLDLLSSEAVANLDKLLVWHRLYFPDIPAMSDLYTDISKNTSSAQEPNASTLLLTVLASLAIDAKPVETSEERQLQTLLRQIAFREYQRLMFDLPSSKSAILALQLILEYQPSLIAIDRTTITKSVSNPTLRLMIYEIARKLHLEPMADYRQSLLREGVPTIGAEQLNDLLLWFRVCLAQCTDTLAGDTRDALAMNKAARVVSYASLLLASDSVPLATYHAVCIARIRARELSALLRMRMDPRTLTSLEETILTHRHACEEEREQLQNTVRGSRESNTELSLATLQLINARLHRSYCSIAGAAMFFVVMDGSHTPTNDATTSDPPAITTQHALETSDQIIHRLAGKTREQQVGDSRTMFLITHGEYRMQDLEMLLVNFVGTADLSIDGVPFVPSQHDSICHILFTCKDIMEENAARMKGWGGLHDRAAVQSMLIQNCASLMRNISQRERPGSNSLRAAREGCLWAGTARLLESLMKLLAQWRRWDTLGSALVERPMRRNGPDSESSRRSDEDGLAVDMMPEDLFFDWELWLKE